MNALQTIQQKLKAPKSQYNKFGSYHYRNQEDILEALKPLLLEVEAELTLSDEIVELGGFLFVKSTATLVGKSNKPMGTEQSWSTSAFARHANEQKGMSDPQITGAASSYARKYVLSGLFLLDDNRDNDVTNKQKKEPDANKQAVDTPVVKPDKPETKSELPWLNSGTKEFADALLNLAEKKTSIEELKKTYRISKATESKLK